MKRLLILAGVTALSLSACGKTDTGGAGDPYAGLESQILSWRTAIEAGHPSCSTKVDGKGCADFQVTCKAAQIIAPDETARGVSAKVVAAMTFNGRTSEGVSGQPGSAFALFSKTGSAWTRAESPPVNLTSCAPV